VRGTRNRFNEQLERRVQVCSSCHDHEEIIATACEVAHAGEVELGTECRSNELRHRQGTDASLSEVIEQTDLPVALIVNPYDTDGFADAMERAATMSAKERRQRMVRMRLRIEENNIYRWAGDLLSGVAEARGSFAPRA
jgi:hypothetical protein